MRSKEEVAAYLAEHNIKSRLEAALQQVVHDQPADPISAIAALLSVPHDGTALAAADASTTLAITVNHGERGEAALLNAARMLGGSKLASQCGLAAALEKLSVCSPPPADVTSWLAFRLRELRPVVVVADYPEPVLKGLLMKCDEFANIHLLKTERPHPEVWNFRKTETAGLAVFGSGQCHLDGLAFLGAQLKSLGYTRVLWFNMREEPVVFLNGQACAPRSANNMNENVEHLTSIQGHELDSMEKRLCEDCVEAAAAGDKTLGVYYQLADGSNDERQLPVPPDRSLPVRGAYEWLNGQDASAQLVYHRVPIADETAPEEQDFDQLVSELREIAYTGLADDVALVFNCQMGRGRTTTGMVCGSILLLASRGWQPPPDTPRLPEPAASGHNLKRGEYTAVLELLRLVDSATQTDASAAAGVVKEDRGWRAKALVDQCCDDCGHAQNMVEAIVACTESAKTAEPGGARSPEFWSRRAHNYLERYAYILLFAAYALEEVHSGFEATFTEWSHRHWQFKRVIKHLTLLA